MTTVRVDPAARTGPPRRPARRPSRLRRGWDRHWYAWAMVLPVVVVLTGLVFYPLVRGIYLSFTNFTEANQAAEICTRSITGAVMARLGLINSLASLVIAYLTIAVPFCTWMLKGYFDSIPASLDEAAAIDGCGPFQTFWRVVLPLSRPGLAVTAFYCFLTAWAEVAYASAFIQEDGKFTLAYGLQQFVPQFNPQWEYLAAAAVLVTIPAGVVFFFAQRHLVSGLTAGGTKG